MNRLLNILKIKDIDKPNLFYIGYQTYIIIDVELENIIHNSLIKKLLYYDIKNYITTYVNLGDIDYDLLLYNEDDDIDCIVVIVVVT